MDAQHKDHPRASRIANLTQVILTHCLDVSKLRSLPFERYYDTETDITTVTFLLYYESEIFGFVRFSHQLGTTSISYQLEKNGEVLNEGASIKDWLIYLKRRQVLRPWVEV